MPRYQAPLRDIRFVYEELLDFSAHYERLDGCQAVDQETAFSILAEAAKFAEQELAPLNRSGDEEGCLWTGQGVRTPRGFKEAYRKFIDAGWPTLSVPGEWGGGQGLPESLNLMVSEMISTANVSWSGYSGLSQGAIKTLMTHGSAEQQTQWLPSLVTGKWTGTMCLTEAQCGSDLGLVRATAVPEADGSYSIEGTKVFISNGDHDVAENIVHIVLARIQGAPAGTRGLSLFVVPKIKSDLGGNLLSRNQLSCGSIENKMGIHGFATCVMNFDGAQGYLIGEPGKGLPSMFTFMNFARVHAGLQGLVHSESAYQGAVNYAHERLAMRSLSGVKNPAGEADPIIVHPDVRRMLFTIKAFAEGARVFAYYLGQQMDLASHARSEKTREEAELSLAFLTPIFKGFITEIGTEAASLGIQVYGGHGYIREWGMEQNFRDSRISTLYEGTTGIQALDLLARKVLGSGGNIAEPIAKLMVEFCKGNAHQPCMREFIEPLRRAIDEWVSITNAIGIRAHLDPDEIGAASVDYLMFSGYIMLGYFWARTAAQVATVHGYEPEQQFYKAKLHTARFYFQRIFPRTESLKITMQSGAGNLMAMAAEGFSLNT